MANKSKYYVVWIGNEPGIYDSWEECQLQIKGFPNARYKSFKSLEAANKAFAEGPDPIKVNLHPGEKQPLPKDVIVPSMSVDGACSGNPGKTEYRGVMTDTQIEVFRQGPYLGGSNNLGEFLALVHALAYLKRSGQGDLPIYSDSRTALSWLRNKKVKTTIPRSDKNKKIFELVDRAVTWIHQNNWHNPILKWDTAKWGEIPADFGRK